jgi:hypothetical protein
MNYTKLSTKLYAALLKLDTMGPTPSINYNGMQNYQSILGTLFTLIAIILSFITISSIIQQAIYKTNPSYYVSSTFDDSDLTLSPGEFPLYLSLSVFNLTSYKVTPIPKSDIIIPPYYTTVLQNRTGYFPDPNFKNMVDCDDKVFADFNTGFISERSFLSQSEINEIKAYSYCLPPVNFTLTNTIDVQSFLTIFIKNGAVKREFDEQTVLAISVNYRSVLVKPNNFDHHYQRIWKEFFYPANLKAETYYRFYLQNYNIKKDQTTFLFTDELNTNVINGDNPFPEVVINKDVGPGQIISGLTLTKSNMSSQAYLKYTSFNDVLSSFGGSFGIFYSVFQILVQIIIQPIFKTDVINNIFSFYSTEDNDYGDKIFKQYVFSKNTNHSLNKIDINNNDIEKANLKENPVNLNKEEFMKDALDRITKNKKVKIDIYYLKNYFYCCKKSKKSSMISGLIETCENFIENNLNVANIIKRDIMLQKVLHIFFDKNEIYLLGKNSFNVAKCGCLKINPNKEIGNENLLKLIMDYNYDERKNRKLLKCFIKNNY